MVLAAALLTPGCVSDGLLARLSSGQVGCRPSAIAIADSSTGWGESTWTAVCEGQLYYCSGAGNAVRCAPAKGAL